ncbi:tetratricopeptide repeat protein, partial [Rhodospirillaceae bacterium]|nr:tetratricopeptide repeat protein [Rhodospirillaceae bacterium]
EEALVSYEKAIELKADYADAYSNLGSTLNHLGRLEEALKNCMKAIALKPEYAEAYYNYGYADAYSNRVGERDEYHNSRDKLRFYKRTILLKPLFSNAYNNLGNLLKKHGNYLESIEHYKKAISLRPSAFGYSSLGGVFGDYYQYTNAINCFNKAFYLEPFNPQYYKDFGTRETDFDRPLLLSASKIQQTINHGDWTKSEALLHKACRNNPSQTEDFVESFIDLWSLYCLNLINNHNISTLLPIFLTLSSIPSRNKNFDEIKTKFCKVYDKEMILEQVSDNSEIIIRVIYWEHKLSQEKTEDFEKELAEIMSVIAELIRLPEKRDLGWSLVTRCLQRCGNYNLARNTINNLIVLLEV